MFEVFGAAYHLDGKESVSSIRILVLGMFLFESIISMSFNSHHADSNLHFNRKKKDENASGYDDTDHSNETYASEEDEDLPLEEQSTVMRILQSGSIGGSSSGAPVYEEVDSFSAESPRYAIRPQAVTYRSQPIPPPPPQASSPPESKLVALDAQERSQIEPEEEMKISPNSSGRDFLSESLRDFSIGSRKSSPDPSGDRLRALPPFSADSASDDITNDELFEVQEQVSRAQSYVTHDSNISEELDEPRSLPIPPQYDVKQGARHNVSNSSNLSPLNESSKEGRRSSDSQIRSESGSERSASRSGSRRSGSQQSGSYDSGSRQSGSRRSGSYHSGSKHSSEHSQEMEQIPPPPVYRPKAVRQKSQSSQPKSKSRSRSGSGSRGKGRSGSRGKGRNGSRESARSKRSQRNQEIYTDSDNDSAEDSPPPTLSDSGKSQKSNLSGFSQGSPATQSRSKSTRSGKKKGPPPPPFQRSEVDESPQYFTDHDSRRPVSSVFTKSGLSGEDSVVSDPTLDAAFHNAPAPVPVPTRNTSARIPRNHSDPSFDKDKSVTSSPGSDSPEKFRRSSSDELPPSEKNSNGSGDEKVDNIVAAALAYAEKTHSLSSFGHQISPAPQSHKPKKRPSGSSSSRRRRRKSDPEVRSHTSGTSSGIGSSAVGSGAVSGASGVVSGASLHSFYSGDDGKKSLESKGTQPSVADMVSAALAYAEETRQQQRQRSEKSQSSSKHTKSVGSMFSDSDAYSEEADEKNEFKC